jgi:hypothetical protein
MFRQSRAMQVFKWTENSVSDADASFFGQWNVKTLYGTSNRKRSLHITRRMVMGKNHRRFGLVFMGTAVLVMTLFFLFPMDSPAKQEVVAIEGMSYNVNASMADNLKSLLGKKVSLTTVSGKTLVGIVKEVGNHLVHLEKIEGKEFYDGLILMEDISVVEAMFRNYQR